jgi:hypothetical protein
MMKYNFLTYVLLGLQIAFGLFLWVVSFIGLAPGYINEYTGIMSPLNYTWYALAGWIYAFLVGLFAFVMYWWTWDAKADSEALASIRAYYQIFRAHVGYFLIYALLFWLGYGVNYTRQSAGSYPAYTSIVLIRPSSSVNLASPLLIEYFSNWMSILALYIAVTTYIVYWTTYMVLYGQDSGIWRKDAAVKGIGAKSGGKKKADAPSKNIFGKSEWK